MSPQADASAEAADDADVAGDASPDAGVF